MAIHPAQVDIIIESFSPSPEEVALRLMPLCRPDFTGNGGIYAHGAEGLHAQ